MSILAMIVGDPTPSERLSPEARRVLESFSLEEWAAAAPLLAAAQERERQGAVAAVAPSQVRDVGQAFDRLVVERYSKGGEARSVIDRAIANKVAVCLDRR